PPLRLQPDAALLAPERITPRARIVARFCFASTLLIAVGHRHTIQQALFAIRDRGSTPCRAPPAHRAPGRKGKASQLPSSSQTARLHAFLDNRAICKRSPA